MPHRLDLTARFGTFTISLNGMVVRQIRDVSSPRLYASLDRWLVDGDNVLRVEDLFLSGERRSWIRFRVATADTTVAEGSRDGPTAEDNLEVHFECPAGTGQLEEGRCLEISEADRSEIFGIVEELHRAVQGGDSQAVVSLLSHRIPLDAKLASLSPAQLVERLRSNIESLADDGLQVLPLGALALRTVCRDSRVVVERPNREPPIVAVSEESRFQMRLAFAKIGGYWAIVA